MLDITSHYEVDEPVDFVYHMASPASPIDYARLPLHTLKVGRLRHPQLARPGQGQARALPARLHLRGLRRPARAPAARELLGQRQPDRPARRLRRGQALRGGADDGLPAPAGRGHLHRADLQYLRPADAAQRRPGRSPPSSPGPDRQAAHRVRRRVPDPLASASSTTSSAGWSRSPSRTCTSRSTWATPTR